MNKSDFVKIKNFSKNLLRQNKQTKGKGLYTDNDELKPVRK